MENLLFSPIKINKTTVKNRILFPGMSTKHSAMDGHSTERMIRYYEERAKGGAGIVTVEASYVDIEGRAFTRGLSIAEDADIEGLSEITAKIHKHGSLASIQLMHGGYASLPEYSGRIALVSFIPGKTSHTDGYVLTENDIKRLVIKFADAAERAKKAGFDFVELHGAHGYLLMQFFSPILNKRTDVYGGSLDNRMRFPLEVLKAVRERVGKDFGIIYRMSAVDGLQNGITLEDSKALAQKLVAFGADAIHVSVGARETRHIVAPPSCVSSGWNACIARAIKDAVNSAVPVIVAGRVNNESVALDILEREDADMVTMGRALIADPHLPNLVKDGKIDDVLRCVGCNDGCSNGSAQGTGIACALNPLAGNEANYDLSKTDKPKKVLIIGAGPAGINAALSAHAKGHTVFLYEKSDRIGGTVNVAMLPPFKDLYGEYVKWAWRKLLKCTEDKNMHIKLSCEATMEEIKEAGPDVILLASGSQPIFPGFCRSISNVFTAQQILEMHDNFPKTALVLGGGLVGCETADFLLKKNCKVTVVEMQPQLAKDMEYRTKVFMMERLNTNQDFKAYTDTKFESVDEQGQIHVTHLVKGEMVLPSVDAVVLALGYRSEQSLYVPLLKEGYDVRLIGDSGKVGKIWHAVTAGFEAGINI